MGTTGNKFSENYTGERISLNKLLKLIEKNGGPKGLNLKGKDLSGIKLSSERLKEVCKKRKSKITPTWIYEKTGGINLEGVNLSWANLYGADLDECCLRFADLRGADLRHVDFIDADLSNAILWDAKFDSAVLDGANLNEANIFGANFGNSTVSRENTGETIIQEHTDYDKNSGFKMGDNRNRFWQASKIYRELKSTFDNSALYNDASWAYRKARKMEKHLALDNTMKTLRRKELRAFINNATKWASDIFVELLSDYGENPWRVFVSLNVVWLGFAIIYWLISGIILSDTGIITKAAVDALAFSLGTMTTIQPVGLEASNSLFMRFLMPVETLFAIALTGLFGYVLGNRINRV